MASIEELNAELDRAQGITGTGQMAFGERFEWGGVQYEALGSYWGRGKMESDRDLATASGVPEDAVRVIYMPSDGSGTGGRMTLAFRADQAPAARDAIYGPGVYGRPAE